MCQNLDAAAQGAAHACSVWHAVCGMQCVACSGWHAVCSMQVGCCLCVCILYGVGGVHLVVRPIHTMVAAQNEQVLWILIDECLRELIPHCVSTLYSSF